MRNKRGWMRSGIRGAAAAVAVVCLAAGGATAENRNESEGGRLRIAPQRTVTRDAAMLRVKEDRAGREKRVRLRRNRREKAPRPYEIPVFPEDGPFPPLPDAPEGELTKIGKGAGR